MVREIERKFELAPLVAFAVGLIPWICRVREYGSVGATYEPSADLLRAIDDVVD